MHLVAICCYVFTFHTELTEAFATPENDVTRLLHDHAVKSHDADANVREIPVYSARALCHTKTCVHQHLAVNVFFICVE